jgi:hypothetical protein
METCCTTCQAWDMADPIVSCDSCGATSDETGMVYCDVIYCEDCHTVECVGECEA